MHTRAIYARTLHNTVPFSCSHQVPIVIGVGGAAILIAVFVLICCCCWYCCRYVTVYHVWSWNQTLALVRRVWEHAYIRVVPTDWNNVWSVGVNSNQW